MPITDSRTEVLAIRGRINEAGIFIPGRCTSTFFVRQWPASESSRYVIELLDREGRPLHREPAVVEREQSCDPGEVQRWLVTAYIGLRDEADAIQLRHGDLMLWRRPIPERAHVEARLDDRRVSREARARLRIRYSEPGEGAFIKILYQWGERRFEVVDVVTPTESIEVAMAVRPGGPACRFVVIYSNGLRAASAATLTFPLIPLVPTVTILQPKPRTILTTGQPLVLEGQVTDPERPGESRVQEHLTWWVDGNLIGRGPIAGVERLAEGRHRVTLRYDASEDADASTSVIVQRGAVPPADQWPTLDDWGKDYTLRSSQARRT